MNYNYKNVKYDQNWYEGETYRFQDQVLNKKNSVSALTERAFNHTSRHGRTDIQPLVFLEGKGPFLVEENESLFLDFGSGIYVTNLGHSHPKVAEAVSIEAKKLMNCHDYITPVKVSYMEKLSEKTDNIFDNIHLYDNGTTGVEIAIKMARAITGKNEIISCFSDHHGKTLGSASLGRLSKFNGSTRMPGYYMVPRPNLYRPIWEDKNGFIDTDKYFDFYDMFIKESTTGDVAAFLVEPIQGWGGGIMPPDDFFPKLQKFCEKRNILLITDEVLTGCGRTGKWMCTEHWNIEPDISILGKGIGNGFPMSAVLTKNKFKDEISKIGPSTTFGGNPMACGAGLATLEVHEENNIEKQSEENGLYLKKCLNELKNKYHFIGDVRGMGSMIALEFVKDKKTKVPFSQVTDIFYDECLKRNLIPGIPVINLIRIAPPLIINKSIIDTAIKIMDEAFYEVKINLEKIV